MDFMRALRKSDDDGTRFAVHVERRL